MQILVMISLFGVLTLLTGGIGVWVLWRRWYTRCVTCAKAIQRRFPHCPWCGQMQFSKTRKPVSGGQPRRRASLPTGERLALLLHPRRRPRGTVILTSGTGGFGPAREQEQTMVQATVRTPLVPPCCSQCGHRIEGMETFCGHCGHSVR